METYARSMVTAFVATVAHQIIKPGLLQGDYPSLSWANDEVDAFARATPLPAMPSIRHRHASP